MSGRAKKIKVEAQKKKSFDVKKILLIVAIAVAFLSIIFVAVRKNKEIPTTDELVAKSDGEFLEKSSNECERLKVWTISIDEFSEYAPSLRTHNRVFSRLNYDFVNASNGDDWDILWALESPFSDQKIHPIFNNFSNKLHELKPHQKVNHFPGISSLVSKSYMSDINRKYDYILPNFELPNEQEEFDEYIKNNPNKKILEKNVFNRGVKIVNVKDLKPKEDYFYQEFMDNPFLIDGHAFDFGVFVLITSFEPIRAYRFNEVLLRFCAEEYHPFDPLNREKYVVQDGSIPVYEMPSFADDYKNFKFTAKLMFERLIEKRGFSVEDFWLRVDRAIAQTIVNAQKNVIKHLTNLTFSSHYSFEVVRFDIILDVDLKPYIVEVNMSPNLTPAAEKYEENSLTYEQFIYNSLKMIGGSSHHEFHSRFDSTDSIVSNYKNLATSPEICFKPECSKCEKIYCEICHPCMSSDVRYQLSEAFREHQNSANFKRVFPTENHFNDEKLISKMTKKNQIQMRWFKGKCEEDKRWC